MNMNISNNGTMAGANIVHDNGGTRQFSSSRGSTDVSKRDMYKTMTDSLASYLERPVLIEAMEWGMGVTLYNSYNILDLIFAASPIKDKLQYFANISFNIEISLEVAANPFLYGMLMANWVPYPKYDGLIRDRGIFFEDNVEASQRQKIFIDASTSTGGTMTIPFYWPANYFSLVKDSPEDFGYLSVRQLNPLMHVTGADQKVTVYIRARLIDVRMHTSSNKPVGALTSMSLQADESPDDKLSSKATRLADLASSLTPYLGGYAIATEKAARVSAAALRAMGLSHPRSKEMIHQFENRPIGNLTNFNVPTNTPTLALDEHNEVTVDPTISGMSEDEMSFDYILKKETFIGTYDWDINDLEGTVLAFHRVHPMQWMYSSTGPEVHMSTLAYLSRMFQYWTGSLVFRFQIVISAWHRGKLRILHEPAHAINSEPSTWQTNVQSVIDITEDREFEITVSFAQAQEWLKVGDFDTLLPPFKTSVEGSTYTSTDLIESNGVLMLSVMNRLVIPDDTVTAPAHINVFVRAGDDFQLAAPTETHLDSLTLINNVSPPPAGRLQSVSGPTTNMIVSPIGNILQSSTGPPVPGFNRDVSPTVYAYLGTTSHPITLTVQKVTGTGTNITLSTSAGSSGAATYGSDGHATLTVPLPSGSGYAHVPITVGMDNNAFVKVISATIPVQSNHEWISAWGHTTAGRLDYDSVNDLNPSYAYPLTMLTTGAPGIFYVAGSSKHLYETANNGQPVFITYDGDIRIVNGTYNPTLVNFDDPGTIATAYYTPPGTGYGSGRVNIGTQYVDVGRIYNVLFCRNTTMSTQADEHVDNVAQPEMPGNLATLHDTTISDKIAYVYMGERVTHVRQMIGRPFHVSTSYIDRNNDGKYSRTYFGYTNIPSYPKGTQTPFNLMMACYNGWHGTTRTKYVLNYQGTDAPSYVVLFRPESGTAGLYYENVLYDLTLPTDRDSLFSTSTTLWSGATVTNPRLANEISAEFPYYYRFRFRSARPSDPSTSNTTTDYHVLAVENYSSSSPVLIERYFQPGEDLSFFNWMGTPVLYPSS